MEAESIGRCVITCNTIGCKDTVINQFNGFLVEPKNVTELAKKCLFLLDNPSLVIEMGHNARKFAINHFDENAINNKILQFVLSGL